MRKKQSFLLTMMAPEEGDSAFCGKIKVISSGKSLTFTSVDELYALIATEMSGEGRQQLASIRISRGSADKPIAIN